MKKNLLIAVVFVGIFSTNLNAQEFLPKIKINKQEKTLHSQWKGKRIAFLGDSMTDPRRVGTNSIYWEYLSELLGIVPVVYGQNGHQWDGIYNQAKKLNAEKGNDIDAVFIFAGTNDYNQGLPIGEFFSYSKRTTNSDGKETDLNYRTPLMNDSTFCGRINQVMSYLKETYPQQQIVLLTPIHRGYAKFGKGNVQPEENFANRAGLFIDDYVETIRKAGSVWSVPVIDLYAMSGLFPLSDSHLQYFAKKETDRLHPNASGHYRIAKTLQYQLLALPSGFTNK